MTGARNAPSCCAAIGASGSGKSLWIKGRLDAAKPDRLLVWDPQGEYATYGRTFDNRSKLLAQVRESKSFAIVYQPGDVLATYADRFDWFCRLAYALGETGAAIGAATATTVMGFAAFIIADSGGLRGIGVLAVLGIGIAAITALLVLPSLAAIFMRRAA